MTQSQFASLHSITIGTVKRWWKKGYLAGTKAINGRVTLTGKYTRKGLIDLCGQRNVLADEKRGLGTTSNDPNSTLAGLPQKYVDRIILGNMKIVATLQAIAGQLVEVADKLEGKERQ